eukprot:TRINITY_DN5876_c0_g1_i2.p2 TRINITY_DN5876_c0_g1~~TRINITY_DN5876_c0_g1_i2.p2  ORF type:complete len:163 (+),score=63.21 TRINITY_DN5876_c0_g1_i2:352-840(+)
MLRDRVARGMTHHYEASESLLRLIGPHTAVRFEYWHPCGQKLLLAIDPLQYSYLREGYAGMLRTINATEPGFQVCVKTSDRAELAAHGDDVLALVKRHPPGRDPEAAAGDDDERNKTQRQMKLLEEEVARQREEVGRLSGVEGELAGLKREVAGAPMRRCCV